MSKNELALWQSRKLHADNVWKENGLMAKRGESSMALRLLNAYATQTWDRDAPWGGLHPDELVEVPTIFSVINTQKAQMFAREPEVEVVSSSPDSVEGARTMERLQNHIIRSRKLGLVRQLNRWLDWALVLHGGVLRHGFTPRERVFDQDGNLIVRSTNIKPDFPWWKAWPLWDVRFDPMAESFHAGAGCRWVAFRDFYLMDEIDRDPGFIKREDLRPTGMSQEARFARPDVTFRGQSGTKDANDLVEVWTWYDVIERKRFATSPGSDKPLMDPEDWEIKWEDGPWTWLAFNEQLHTAFPIPPPLTIRHQAIERNKIRTLMMDLIKRQRNLIGLRTDLIHNDDVDRMTSGDGPERVEFFRYSGEGVPVGETRVANFDLQGLLAADERLLEDAREAFGQSRLDRAQRINVETATEAASVQQGSDLQRGRLMGTWEDALSDAFAAMGQGLQSPGVLTDDFTVPILGVQDARELATEPDSPFLTVRPNENRGSRGTIRGEFIYQIKPGSTAQRDPQREVRESLADLQLAAQFPQNVNIPQLLLDYAVARDKDPEKFVQTPQEIQRVQQGLAQGQTVPTESDSSQNLAAILGANGGGVQ